MMEVKQNTAVDLNNLLVSPKNMNDTNELDDAVMSVLSPSDETPGDIDCDLIKSNVAVGDNGLDPIINGSDTLSTISDVSEVKAVISAESPLSSTETENALPSNENTSSNVAEAKISTGTEEAAAASNAVAVDEDILADKIDVSNSTSSSNNVRDPGDDLDTLLSKINDIVDDCYVNDAATATTLSSGAEDDVLCKDMKALDDVEFALPAEVNTKPSEDTIGEVDDGNTQDETVDDLEAMEQELLDERNEAEKDESVPAESEVEKSPVKEQGEKAAASSEEEITNSATISTEEEQSTVVKTKASEQTHTNENGDIENGDAEGKSNTESATISSRPIEDEDRKEQTEDIINDINEEKDKVIADITKEDNSVSLEEAAEDKCPDEDNNSEGVTLASETTEDLPTEKVAEACDNNDKVQINEESDDEIVFYVDEKPEEKDATPEKENVPSSSADEEIKIVGKEKSTRADDTVVILDDDDDVVEDLAKPSQPAEQSDAKEGHEKSEAQADKQQKSEESINLDNSDNACDEFKNEKTTETSTTTVAEDKKEKDMDETNSNCSSSSNLLLEAKGTDNNERAQDEQEQEQEHEEEDDDGDVELVENETKETETTPADDSLPPAKRPRLSEDSQISTNTDEAGSIRSIKSSETETKTSDEPVIISPSTSCSSLKRSHDIIELELDDSDTKASCHSGTKKARTDEHVGSEDIAVTKSETDTKTELKAESSDEDAKELAKMIPSYKPIPLYPPPKLEALDSKSTVSLDFLKKFRKSFDKMTKQDLEELVLQKVVEAIIHKSEFAEMRDLIEKQEKLIATHRTKITELTKQFRDLEMVHNRVVKDIEQRNAQFIMPVKITRAVGLQVYIPNKKTMIDPCSPSTGGLAPPMTSIPASSPQRPASVSSQGSTNSSQRSQMASQATETSQPRTPLTSAVNATVTSTVRRGCAQKVTPTRPMPGSSSSAPSTSTASVTYRGTNITSIGPASATQPRILNKNVMSPAAGPSSSTPGPRNRYMTTSYQQQQSPASRTPVSGQRMVVPPKAAVANAPLGRRSEPAAPTSSSSSSLDNYMTSISHLTGNNTAVSITPAKPKEKAVIDLTEEDETTAATAAPAAPSNNSQPQRRSLPTTSSSSSASGMSYGRNAQPAARIGAGGAVASSKGKAQTSLGPKSYNSTLAAGTGSASITRINVAANASSTQRAKHNHPAPLPGTPPQVYNPAWKPPPPRPTIRISNLDNGIVISWTMEDSMERHADCVSYQIYAYQETSGPPQPDSWRHVGDVKAMLLPMAVTLTQFQEGQRYHFAVRAVDCHQRYGPFSLPKTWT